MDKLITALAPVFAAGFAVQQLLEILTSILDLDSKEIFTKYKKAILGVVSLVLGLILAYNGYLKVLQPLFNDPTASVPVIIPRHLDYFVTALVISAGTEGVNAILKFLKYKKEETKNDAAAKLSSSRMHAVADEGVLGVSPEALAVMNRK